MEDLNAKINSIMSDPDKLRELQKLGQMMGLTGDGKQTPDFVGCAKPCTPACTDRRY